VNLGQNPSLCVPTNYPTECKERFLPISSE
jgi:hypothetical protein